MMNEAIYQFNKEKDMKFYNCRIREAWAEERALISGFGSLITLWSKNTCYFYHCHDFASLKKQKYDDNLWESENQSRTWMVECIIGVNN